MPSEIRQLNISIEAGEVQVVHVDEPSDPPRYLFNELTQAQNDAVKAMQDAFADS